ncbi:MAG TPA: DNA/RNA non-specific endonuclease [Verrucomicrobiae bacterium]|nr:DNA/RNA non-specific endonuclease [Verrucomicrobiae bacterium]
MCCLRPTGIGISRRCALVLLFMSLGTLMVSVFSADAYIDATLQMQLGNPSGATADGNNTNHYLIQRTVEAMDYSDHYGEPTWVSWDLTSGDIGGSGRSPDFYTDPTLPPNFYPVTATDYDGVGNINFARGHMCPSEDRTDNTNDNKLVFYMSNIIPQAANNNGGPWESLESYCRSLADSGNELLIYCGPSGFSAGTRIPSGKAVIPDYTWKIVVVVPLGSGTALSRVTSSDRVIAIKIPNNNSVSSSWQNYLTSARQIEVDTGYTFFTALPPDVANALSDKVDGQTNPPPVIYGFSPGSGAPGDTVIITGTNFASASAVTFNGTSAGFIVNSNTQITATVPVGATSGLISVTAGGTAVSSSTFLVIGLPADLAISTSHSGNFVLGDTADTYAILVANVGSLPSSGAVTVSDILPAGLTVTDMSGDGWTTDMNSLTCTRTDALAAGANYPIITVTVAVATNAPASVTNFVMVSGGGDTNTQNNSAADPTAIVPPPAIGILTTLLGWDVSGTTNYGASPMAPTTNSPGLTVTGLIRGPGVGTSGMGAGRAWGGNTFISTSESGAIAAGEFVSFGAIENNAAYTISYQSISTFEYRHSPGGPTNGVLQYQIGSGAFTDIVSLSYPSSANSGASLGSINLSGIPALQNVPAGTNMTFRIVNYGGTSSSGTWYIFDVSNSPALDLEVDGIVAPVVYPPAIPASFSSLSVFNHQFQFLLAGTMGSNYVVQVSTNLTSPVWISVETNSAPFVFSETNLYPQRFYRAVVAP